MSQHPPTGNPPAPTRSGPRTWSEARAEANERRGRRIRELQRDERFDRLRSVPARRSLVVVGYLLLLVAAALEVADLTGLAGVLGSVVFLGGLGVAFVLHRAVRNTVDAPDDVLDERLVARRDAAYRIAYPAVVWSLLAVLFALLIGAGAGLAVEQRHLQALVWAVALGAVLTPTAVLAWREREV